MMGAALHWRADKGVTRMSNNARILFGRRTHFALRNGLSAVAVALCAASGDATAAPTFTIVDVDGAVYTFVDAINAGGSVTGNYLDAGGTTRGFVRAADGTIALFDPTASISTEPHAINKSGAIVGDYVDATRSHGFLRSSHGKIKRIDPKGSTSTYLTSINDTGSVTGYYYDVNNFCHGFVRTADRTITKFDP